MANLKAPPPAPLGNTRAAKHYGRARNVPGIDDARADLMAALADAAPVRAGDGGLPIADAAAVELAARAIARMRVMDAWLTEHGLFGRGGKLRPAVAELDRATRTASEMLDRLGMNPRSRAALGVDLGRMQQFDLAKHWQESGNE